MDGCGGREELCIDMGALCRRPRPQGVVVRAKALLMTAVLANALVVAVAGVAGIDASAARDHPALVGGDGGGGEGGAG